MNRKQKLTALFVGAAFLFLSNSASATDLMDIYLKSVRCDPVFEAARATRLENREAIPQSLAGLLPNLSATANTTINVSDIVNIKGVPNPLNVFGTVKYNQNGYSVTLTQPIVAPVNWMQVSAAKAQGKQADATFAAAAQDLMIRVARAYFAVLFAQDDLTYTEAEQAANARQLDQVKERFNVGLDPITSVYNAQASYDAVSARLIAAKNTLRDNLEALRRLTGERYDSIEGFKMAIPLQTPKPMDVDQWVNASRNMNLPFLASRYAVAAARSNVKVNFAGHFPTLNAVGNVSRTYGIALGLLDTNNAYAGLQLTVPIFQGGYVSSRTRQAEDQYAAAAAEMVDAYRKATVDTRQRFDDVMSGISQVKADKQAIFSAQSSVDSTEESFKAGVRTIVDVLIAQRQLFQTERDYARDEYNYLLNTLLLKQAAGTLSPMDLAKINCWLENGKTISAPSLSTGYNAHHINPEIDTYSEKQIQKTLIHKPVVTRPLTHNKPFVPLKHEHIAHKSSDHHASEIKHAHAVHKHTTSKSLAHLKHEHGAKKAVGHKQVVLKNAKHKKLAVKKEIEKNHV
jgi:outer membrane protein